MPNEDNEQDTPFTIETDETGDGDLEQQESDAPAEVTEEKTFSQADLDRQIAKRLKRQEEQFTKKYANYDKLEEDAKAYRAAQNEKATDAERWEREKTELLASNQEKDNRLAKLERASLIADLAAERGLPKSFWKRVNGESEEEIAEDIDSILNDLNLPDEQVGDTGKKATPRPKKAVYGGGGENESPDPDTDLIVSKIPRGPQFRIDKPRTYR